MLGNCSFHLENHCFVNVKQIAGLLEDMVHQNFLVSKNNLFGF